MHRLPSPSRTRRAKRSLSAYPERDWAGFVLYGDPGPMSTR